jgi:hypothetical protein
MGRNTLQKLVLHPAGFEIFSIEEKQLEKICFIDVFAH